MKFRKNKDSFIHTIAVSTLSYLVLMVIILTTVWWNTARSLQNTAKSTLSQAKEICNYEIEEVLKSNEQALSVVLQDSSDIKIFEYGSENQKAVASQNIIQTFSRATNSSSYVGNLFFYDLIGDNYIAKYSQNMSHNQSVLVQEKIKELNSKYTGNMPSVWFYEKIGNRNYLLRLYKNKKRMLGALVDITEIFENAIANDQVVYTLTQSDNTVIDQFGQHDMPLDEDLNLSFIGSSGWSGSGHFLVSGANSKRTDINLYVTMTKSQVYGGFQMLQVVIIILVLSAILMLLSITIYSRKVVYAPLKDLLDAMKRIENGDQTCRLPAEADTVEFKQINTSFNQMVDTIVNLRMRSYEERIQFDEATLKYVQLQIKPHFFLNALTTIHSMSFQDRNEEIRDYIERLSRNVRYLFKSGLHTVPLREEIDHIRDYIAMQEILYPGCVFDFIDMEEELSDYPVPQLLIHTILENIYKHAVSVDNLTSILISCKLADKDGEEMCHITVEDDGEGFPEDFLKQFRKGEDTLREDGHGVGLWNLKKTLSLMYRRDDLIDFSNKDPHGSKVDMWIPKRVKRQSSVWKQS